MARYTGARLRVTRRLGDLPGLTSKKGNNTARPGQHGAEQKKLSPPKNQLISVKFRQYPKRILSVGKGLSQVN